MSQVAKCAPCDAPPTPWVSRDSQSCDVLRSSLEHQSRCPRAFFLFLRQLVRVILASKVEMFMVNSSKPLIVALEEHYWDPDLVALFPSREGKRVSVVERRLLDVGELRLQAIVAAVCDIQVLSHVATRTQ